MAIDTSAGTSVAVVDPRRGVLAERSTGDTMRHAEVIGAFIADVLAEASITPADITGVAAGMGPGPFTGLRVGIAAARVFALGAAVPVIPIVSHDAIAYQCYATHLAHTSSSSRLLIVTDARRRELYWSAYDGIDALGLPVRADGPALCKPDDLPHPDYRRVDATEISAGALGLIAALMVEHSRPFAVDEPLYLRSPDVTLSARKRVS